MNKTEIVNWAMSKHFILKEAKFKLEMQLSRKIL
jgi:hypothetical protein